MLNVLIVLLCAAILLCPSAPLPVTAGTVLVAVGVLLYPRVKPAPAGHAHHRDATINRGVRCPADRSQGTGLRGCLEEPTRDEAVGAVTGVPASRLAARDPNREREGLET